MANQRRSTNGRRTQVVYSEPLRLKIGSYVSPKGEKLLQLGLITKKEAEQIYGKNRYCINPNAHIVKFVKHTF